MTKDSAAPLCEDRMRIALQEARDAVDFFDRVKASSDAEKIAVGTDHWTRMESAIRAVAALTPPPQEAATPTEGVRTVSQVVSDWKATGERVAVDTGYETPTRGEAEPVAYISFDVLSDWKRERREWQSVPLRRDPSYGRVALYASQPHAPDSWRPTVEQIAREVDPDAWAHVDACHEAMRECGPSELQTLRGVIDKRLRESGSITTAERILSLQPKGEER